MASFFKSKHHYAESGDCARLGVYLVTPPKIELQFRSMLIWERRPSLLAGFRQRLTPRNKHAGAGVAPRNFWRIGRAAEDSTHYTRCLPLLCLPVLLSACGFGG